MFHSLKSRLWIVNVLTIAVVIGIIVILINLAAVSRFDIYKVRELERTYSEILESVSECYAEKDKLSYLQGIGESYLLTSNVLMTVYDNSGNVVYDSLPEAVSNAMSNHHYGMMGRGMMHMGAYAESITSYNQKEFEITINGKAEGILLLASMEKYSSAEKEYIDSISKMILLIGAAAIVIAVIISNFSARALSRPLSKVIDAAYAMSAGNYEKEIDVKSSINEVKNLSLAMRNLRDNLKNNEKLRRRLTQDIAHELRTPIATIQGNFEAALDGVLTLDNAMINSCYEETQRLTRLVEDLNNLSKYENSALNKSGFDAGALLKNVAAAFAPQAKERGITFSMNIAPLDIYADRDKLTQVFVNLIANAVQYSDDGGSITLGAHQEQGVNIFSVSDTGAGIAENDLPYIFERFYRADKSRNRKTGGAGIGLSIVKAVAESHGGEVSVKSRLGEGTEFTVNLPSEK